MSNIAALTDEAPPSSEEVLGWARAAADAAASAEVDRLRAAVAFCALNGAETVAGGAVYSATLHGDRPLPLAGEGAPRVAEFAVVEWGAVLGRSTGSAERDLGTALEIHWRLPRLAVRVYAGQVPVWRARSVADRTLSLSPAAADFVDQHVVGVAGTCSWATLDRIVGEAIARFDPDAAAEEARAAADARFVDIDTEHSLDGTGGIHGRLGLDDAIALDRALDQQAAQLAAAGATASRDVLRAMALGDLADGRTALELAAASQPATPAAGPDTGRPRRSARRPRQVVLHVHVSEAALRERAVEPDAGGLQLARIEETRGFVTAEQVRAWCADPSADVVVKPVVDLAERIRAEAYEVPDRLSEQVALRDVVCVFPYCTRPARRADKDHVEPHADGGETASDNIASLCRCHHRVKTHPGSLGHWAYTMVEPGVCLWVSATGHRFLVDHRGTTYLGGPAPRTDRRPADALDPDDPNDPPERRTS